MIQGTTRLLGVIGDPVTHSLSPVMHNAAIAHLGIDYVYVPLPVKAQGLEAALRGFAAIGLRGFNITIPHKQAIMPLLTHLSDTAQAVGAVNTVWPTPSGWSGTNTDVEGFLAPLQPMGVDWSTTTALVLGNGGAARAVVAGCTQLGCAAIQVVGRDAQKLEGFLQSWQDSPLQPPLSVHQWGDLESLLPQGRLLVNTTPIGMHPHTAASPLSETQVKHLTPETIAYDLIYTPSPTLFLAQAKDQGAIAIDGMEMLVQQGAAALKIWLEVEQAEHGEDSAPVPAIPVVVMRDALKRQLERRIA